MSYPANLDNPALTSDDVDDVDETLLNNRMISPIRRTQGYVGTTGDPASGDDAATLTSKVKQLQFDVATVYGIALWGGGD